MASDSLIRAAGVLLWQRDSQQQLSVALVHRPRYQDWSLPKGKAIAGEALIAAAARELTEETGYIAALGRALTTVSYAVGSRPKTVQYYSGRLLSGSFAPNKETDKLVWLPLPAAKKKMTYEFDQAVLAAFAAHRAELATAVLVRHARAGSRDAFSGPDTRRPLDTKGDKQAAALVAPLLAVAPQAIYAAPLRRCVDTVVPVAGAAGLSIHLQDALAEEVYRDHPSAPRKRLVELVGAADPARGAIIACSQGGVIPGVVKALAARGQARIGKASTPKASFWVLSFDGDQLVQADPHPAPVV